MTYRHREAAYRLVVDGREIALGSRLISLSLTERRGTEADELRLELDDSDGRLAVPPSGAEISLALGWRFLPDGDPILIDKGTFKVDERSHAGAPDRLVIRARSADLTRAFRTRRTESWQDVDLGQVLRDLAGRHGLEPRIDPTLAARAIDHLEQGRESDAAFLARLGRQHDAVATIKAGRLLFAPASAAATPGGTPIPPATLTRASGDRHDWKEIERGAYSGVIAVWRDRAGARRRQVVVGDADNAKRLGRTYAGEAAARRAADAEWARLARGRAQFSLALALGRPDLYPQRRLSVSGFKPEIDAEDWLIDEAAHDLSARGFTTSLKMERGGS